MDSALLLKIIADNDQDRAAAIQWWRETPEAGKLAVWSDIQRQARQPDPVASVVGRFAQLAFAELAAEEARR
jgi:hypothetical protein